MAEIPKLKIEAFDQPEMTGDPVASFQVQLNPENYNRRFQIKYNDQQASGSDGGELRFDKIDKQKIDFEFLFDETGAIQAPTESNLGVDERINGMKEAMMRYDGSIHRPRYLKIVWATLLFKCCLESLDVSYKLFKPDGTPLRATVRASFVEFTENELRVRRQDDSSPDLTHKRIVKMGDTLPRLTFEIYGDSKYYLEVAKANGLVDFRNLAPGSVIFFPSVQK